MISQRFRFLNLISRADLSSFLVFIALALSFLFRGCALSRRLDNFRGCCKSRSRRLVMRKDAFVTFVADTLFMERANSVMMEFAILAFVAFPFQIMLELI